MAIPAVVRIAVSFTIVVGLLNVTITGLDIGQDRSIRAAVPRATVSEISSGPTSQLFRASPLEFTGDVDSNSPVLTMLVDGQPTMVAFTSFGGVPSRSSGPSLASLSAATPVTILSPPEGGIWIEAVIAADDGTLYGFYHNERTPARCRSVSKTAPRIGVMRSRDDGVTWTNLGILIQASSSTFDCETLNTYIVGGVGDFSATLDGESRYVYLSFSEYGSASSNQGVATARFLWADRDAPVGKTEIWSDGQWLPASRPRPGDLLFSGFDERGLVWGMAQPDPIFPTKYPWHDGDMAVDAFWGPSIHWNTYLERYVMLVNRAKDETFGPEGIYISYNATLSDPEAWSPPVRIVKGGSWYPQAVGLEGDGSDARAGRVARFFVHGRSDYVIYFDR